MIAGLFLVCCSRSKDPEDDHIRYLIGIGDSIQHFIEASGVLQFILESSYSHLPAATFPQQL
jgi:hypothetical protein